MSGTDEEIGNLPPVVYTDETARLREAVRPIVVALLEHIAVTAGEELTIADALTEAVLAGWREGAAAIQFAAAQQFGLNIQVAVEEICP